MSVALYAGWNAVVYKGKAQLVEDAFASIMPYITTVYYWNNLTDLYEIPVTGTFMVPYRAYWIDVTQNCTWTYGADATAPSSVYLYAGFNMVPWCGEAIPPADAFASILSYLDTGKWIGYFNNVTKEYEIVGSIRYGAWYPGEMDSMVPNGAYFINVIQNIRWSFVAPEVVPCEITITAPSSAKEGTLVGADITVKNVSPYHYSYKATIYAVPDLYPDYVIGSIDQVITSGSSVLRNVSFTMPDCNVTVFVWVEREGVYDNSASRVVSLEVPATFHLSVHVPSWAAGGYIDPGSGDYPAYSTVKLTAHPLSGYQFTSWGGDASGTALTYNLYMNSDKYVEAYFEKIPVPEIYKGSIARKELEYDETRGAIPVY